MSGRPGFMRLGQLEEERADLIGGYQITISLSKNLSFGVLQRMPDGAQITILSTELFQLLEDLASCPTQGVLQACFERERGARP